MGQRPHPFVLAGGLDLVTPSIAMPSGRVIAGVNYEPSDRGYRRTQGHERLDGRGKPSAASYWILNFDAGSVELIAGQTVTGVTSGATGIALFDGTLESGTYGGGDAAGYMVLTDVAGVFLDNESLTIATANGTASERGASTDANDSTFLQRAIERRRTLIDVVPGHGTVRGVCTFDGDIYAIRDHNSAPTSLNVSVAASADDAAEVVSSGAVSITGTALGIQSDRVIGMRFQNITVAAGSVVLGAKVQMASTLDLSADVVVSIRGELSASAVAFTTGTDDISDRPTTTAVATWRPTPWQASEASTPELTLDISPVIQEIIDQTAWVSGNDLVLIMTATGVGARQAAAQDHASLAPAQLQLSHAAAVDQGRLWKDSTAGWVEQSLGNSISFTAGTTEFLETETVTGGVSGASATINRVVVESGDWSTNDAAGRLIIGTVTAGPFQAEAITSASGAATCSGAETAHQLPNGGRYDFHNENFFGSASTERMYAAGGVGRSFEWDGSIFVPIHTGLSDALDKPIRVTEHRKHLLLAYLSGSVLISAIGNPYNWTSTLGAAEVALGHEITDMLTSVQSATIIYGERRISILYGSDSADFELQEFADDVGAIAWTAQRMNDPIHADLRGIRALAAVQAFGNFRRGTLTTMVEPLYRRLFDAGTRPVAALRVRRKDQYRLYWDDGTSWTVSLLHEAPEILTQEIGVTPSCACSGEDATGREILLIGTASGMVYELDAGTNFDGGVVQSFLRLSFDHIGTPGRDKRFHGAVFEMDVGPTASIGVIPEINYGSPDQPPSVEIPFTIAGGGAFWDEGLWDGFYWSSQVFGQAKAHLDGLGSNISLTLVSSQTYEELHGFHSGWINFTYRRHQRF